MTKRAALILAGGKARRFQTKQEEWQDKALAELFGKPLLIHAVENVRDSVDEIVICVNDENRRQQYAEVLTDYHFEKISLVVDEKISHVSGPNVAILTGLKHAKAECCITLPCDVPFLKPRIVDFLFSAAEDARLVVPMWPSGRLETLLMVIERTSGLEITSTLCQLARPRSDDIFRGALDVLFVSPMAEIRAIDPELKSFVNINHPEDLVRLQTRKIHGPFTKTQRLNLGPLPLSELSRLQNAGISFHEGDFVEASKLFPSSADNLETTGSWFWAAVSRENEAENLLKRSQQHNMPELVNELDFEGEEVFLKAAEDFRLEAELYKESNCRFLAERARADKSWCEARAMGKPIHGNRYPQK